MLEGLLVPNNIVQDVLEEYLIRHVKQGKTCFLVDGFPRSVEQAIAFKTRVSTTDIKISCLVQCKTDESRAATSGLSYIFTA